MSPGAEANHLTKWHIDLSTVRPHYTNVTYRQYNVRDRQTVAKNVKNAKTLQKNKNVGNIKNVT